MPPKTKNDSFGLVLELGDELDLTAVEKATVLAKSNEMRRNYFEEDAKLLKKAREAIMKSLTPAQQKQVVDAIGAPFDFDANSGVKKGD